MITQIVFLLSVKSIQKFSRTIVLFLACIFSSTIVQYNQQMEITLHRFLFADPYILIIYTPLVIGHQFP